MKKGGNHQSSALLYYLFEIDYSAFLKAHKASGRPLLIRSG